MCNQICVDEILAVCIIRQEFPREGRLTRAIRSRNNVNPRTHHRSTRWPPIIPELQPLTWLTPLERQGHQNVPVLLSVISTGPELDGTIRVCVQNLRHFQRFCTQGLKRWTTALCTKRVRIEFGFYSRDVTVRQGRSGHSIVQGAPLDPCIARTFATSFLSIIHNNISWDLLLEDRLTPVRAIPF